MIALCYLREFIIYPRLMHFSNYLLSQGSHTNYILHSCGGTGSGSDWPHDVLGLQRASLLLLTTGVECIYVLVTSVAEKLIYS